MQITIAQEEIETAIRNYVLGLISVNENMKVEIDLRATRGAEGFTALIDINPDRGPEGGDKPKAETKQEAKPAAPKTQEAAKPTADKLKAEAEKVTEDSDKASDEPVADAAPEVTKPINSVFAKRAATVAATQPPANEGEAPKSIFGGLARPSNTKTEAAA